MSWLPRRHIALIATLITALFLLGRLPSESAPSDVPGRSVTIIRTAETTELLRGNAPRLLSEQVLSGSASGPALVPPAGLAVDNPLPADPLPAVAEPVEPVREEDTREIVEVRSGDNLSLIFDRAGLSPRDVYEVSRASEYSDILTRLYPGYQLAFEVNPDNRLQSLEVIRSPLESFHFRRGDDGFESRHEVRSAEIRRTFKEATINDSLFLAAQRGGIPASLTMELAGIFGGVIDFLLDTRKGDTFNVLYEERYLDGNFIGNGAILAAQFVNRGETYTAVRYTNAAGESDYFNPEGESMRKAFLRNPVDFVRISSDFNPNRRHPILNTIRAHKGTDYAAPNGTPVVATADGRVTWAARNGSFGNLVVITHNDRFETKYAHLSSYAKGVRNGTRVKQGQVIGFVGATGGATGPHLHYEFLIDGVHRNPRTVHNQLPKAESIPDTEMAEFRQQSQLILADLGTHTHNPTLARNENQEDP